jgi:hypothetical protein
MVLEQAESMSGKHYAVLIGLEQEGDFETLRPVLASHGFENALMIARRPHHEILRSLNETFSRAQPEDLILIWYRGQLRANRAGRLYLSGIDSEDELIESTSVPLDQTGQLRTEFTLFFNPVLAGDGP